MAKGPSEDDVRRAALHQKKARETASAFKPFVDSNKLDAGRLKSVLDRYAVRATDAHEDGVYDQQWLGTDTFYRHTEDYVPPERRAAYKAELERTFPGRKA